MPSGKETIIGAWEIKPGVWSIKTKEGGNGFSYAYGQKFEPGQKWDPNNAGVWPEDLRPPDSPKPRINP